MQQAALDRLDTVLKRVSRSFYLSLRILPRSLRTPIGLAYLFARAADTIAKHAAHAICPLAGPGSIGLIQGTYGAGPRVWDVRPSPGGV